jgi:gliding motility-associated-like protein
MSSTLHSRLFFSLFAIACFLSPQLRAQVPTNQDCLNAIPICQNVYSTQISYSGEGNYPNEINSNSSCLGSGELNDVWYTFTVQQSGNLNFLITPNNSADDYDWSVYNLTNNNCADIFTNPGLEVSCNFSATPGTTGPNGGSNQSSQNAAGTPYNQVVPVVAGQTYVVNVSNYSSTQYGYTIDFGASTAVIFDQTPPTLVSISNPGCGSTTLTFTFSENILCNTVQPADFSITGPGGPYTVTSVFSAACAAGGTYDNQFTITVNPAINQAGNFLANLIGPVTDLCGNICIFPAQLPFVVGSFTYTNLSTPASCNSSNGTATVNVVGNGPFSYVWNPNVSNTNSASNLAAGIYTVTITDQNTGCTSTDTIHVNANNTLQMTTSANDTICPGGTSTMSVNILGGNGPYTYTWNPVLPNQPSVTVSPAVTTTYTVSVVDANGCTGGPLTITVAILPPLTVSILGVNSICAGGSAALSASASGGDGNYTYTWQPGNLIGPNQNVSPAVTTTYTVTATDGCTQVDSDVFTVNVTQLPVLAFTADTTYGCSPLAVNFSIDTTGFGNATFLWDFDDNGATSANAIASHVFTSAGCHDVSLTVTVPPGCSVTQMYPCMITTLPQPTAAFTATPPFTDIENPTIRFDNNSAGFNAFAWSFGDSNSSTTDLDPIHTYDLPGVYPVVLIVTNNFGCSDTAYLDIVVNDLHTFYVPNAFTPNANGNNDLFGPEYTNILDKDYSMLIFDRWGNLVFEGKNPAERWNGGFRNVGEPVLQDVYVYVIEYTDNMNVKHYVRGHISVIR